MQTPSSSRYLRTASPPLSVTASSTAFQPQKLNIVTRLALEGKTKPGWDGAAIKMYLKISLPLDSVAPGSSIALFPEENVKIFDSQVHPIDSTSAPYNFSSTTSPLLNRAAKALNLPARLSHSYLSLFGMSSSAASTSRHSSSTPNGANFPPLDEKYTGTILVSGYNVSFVLPKEFPSKLRGTDSDVNGHSTRNATTSTSFSKRRHSVAEKNVLQFMAAIDMWVPYICTPPKAPYLVSVPTPRCLSNHIKLRIFPPTPSTSNSYASLSSAEDDISSWDLTSDPHVTRTPSSRLPRATSYTDFADDESSDSANGVSPGFADGCGIQGTFPSAERIRVRWAAPLKAGEVPEASDGRRRVGVREVKGEMTCNVLNKRKEGVVIRIDYKGTCKGVWFPGVATLLGMDVSLDAPDCKVNWLPEMESKWSVSGNSGFTGFAVGPPPALSRQSSMADSPQVVVSPATPNRPNTNSRHDSSSSTASLLRTPLPAQSVAEYSFENSTSSLSTGTMSSLGSLGERSRSSSINGVEKISATRPPTVPITLHLNMNDLLPPSNNNFTFNISGIVLVSPRPKQWRESSIGSDDDLQQSEQPLLIPKFRVVYNDTETISTIVRSEVADSIVEVYGPVGNTEDAKTRRTVLHKGGVIKCGTEGGRIILRPVAVTSLGRVKKEEQDIHSSRANSPPSRPRTPNGATLTRYANSASRQMASTLKPKRDGPLMIPSVVVTVTPLVIDQAEFPNAYAVKVTLPAPSDADSEWLEFGLAQSGDTDRPPRVEVASASVEGVPVRFETTAAVKQEKASDGASVPFDQMSGKEWVSWVRVHVGEQGGNQIEVVYLTKVMTHGAITYNSKGKEKAVDETIFNVLLPTFSLPVGRLEVNLESQSGFEVIAVDSNLSHQQIFSHSRKLSHYSMEEYFYPRVSIIITPTSKHAGTTAQHSLFNNMLSFITWTAPAIVSIVLFFFVISLGTELQQMKTSLESCSSMVEAGWSEPEPVTMTVTTTIFPPSSTSSSSSSSSAKWWFTSDSPIPTPSSPTKPPDSDPTIINDPSTPPSIPAIIPSITLTPSPSQTDALTPITEFFRWTLHFDLPPAHVAAEKVHRGFMVLWQVLRKAYHYPLDPT